MFTLSKANKILKLILNSNEDLQDYNINIKQDNKFSVEIRLFDPNINLTITNRLTDNNYNKLLPAYIKDKFNIDSYNKFIIRDFNECFSFLHEVGHIVHYLDTENENEEYNNFYSNKYNTYKEAFYKYREIKTERLADEFAIKMMLQYKKEIWSIMNEISIERALQEIEMWEML